MTHAFSRITSGMVLGGLAVGMLAGPLAGQEPQGDTTRARPYVPVPLFQSNVPLELTLLAPFRQLGKDRQPDTDWREARVSYTGDAGVASVPVRVRTRGVWRKNNCEMPPLLFNFVKDSVKGTPFARIDRLRLTMHCRNQDQYEQYVLQEFQAYRVQRLLTRLSYDVRLARMTYVDSERGDTVARRWGFLQEQDDPFAERVSLMLVEQRGASPADLDPYESAFFGVFQYFVGNSDFSIRELHNVVLLYREPYHIPTARDFDWSGLVNARYAKPNPVLKIRAVTQRIMRGYCAPAEEYEKVFALFRERKDAIYALYRDDVGALMTPDVVKKTLEYFDAFYAIINDPGKARKEIVSACLGGAA